MFFHPTLIKSQEHNWHWTAKTEIFPQENDTWMTGGPEFLWILLKCSFWETFICRSCCKVHLHLAWNTPKNWRMSALHCSCITNITGWGKSVLLISIVCSLVLRENSFFVSSGSMGILMLDTNRHLKVTSFSGHFILKEKRQCNSYFPN